MQEQLVRQRLSELNLNFDLSSISDIVQLVSTLTPSKFEEPSALLIFSAAAIIEEIKRIPSVDQSALVRTGITIEKVMRHLSGFKKEQFLDTIQHVVAARSQLPSWVGEKANTIDHHYTLFNKYKACFNEIASEKQLDIELASSIMGIVWVLYLTIKQSKLSVEDYISPSDCIQVLLSYVFTGIIETDQDLVFKHLQQYFQSDSNTCISPKYQHIKEIAAKTLTGVHLRRYQSTPFHIQASFQDQDFLERFLDDFCTIYERSIETKSLKMEEFIDQISFLELSRTLAPKSIVKSIKDVEPIHKQLNFTNSEIEEDTLISEKKAGIVMECADDQEARAQIIARKSSERIQALSWVNNCLGSLRFEEEFQVMKSIYEEFEGKSIEDYKQKIEQKLQRVVECFSPDCRDMTKRKTSIFKLAVYFITKIWKMYQQEQYLRELSHERSLDSIVCLTANLFNFCYKAIEVDYIDYCHIFDLTILDGFIPINWFGKNAALPAVLQDELYRIEKKILIRDLWLDSTGYELIKLNGLMKYKDVVIARRLQKHVMDRTIEIATEIEIDEKLQKKILNLVRHIIDHKSQLLKNNKLDAILLCCIASCSNLNKHFNQTLQKVFTYYSKLSIKNQALNKCLYDQYDNSLNLLEYYNRVFLSEVQKIFDLIDANRPDIELTPIRNQRIQMILAGCHTTPTFFKMEPTQSQGTFQLQKFNSNLKNTKSYIKGLVQAIQKNQEDHESNQDADEFNQEADHESNHEAIPQA